MTINRKELVLEGLNCAHCASKMEKEIQSIPKVINAVVNFPVRTLVVEWESTANQIEIDEKVGNIIHKHEPEIMIREKTHRATFEQFQPQQASQPDKINQDGHRQSQLLKDITELLSFKKIAALIAGTGLFILALILELSFSAELTLFLLSYFLIGGEVVQKAVGNIVRGQIFDENFLMFIATVGAFGIQEFPEAVAVMLFYQVGEFFQDMAVNRSRRSISSLMDIRPDYANLKEGENDRKVSPLEIQEGQIIIVKPGEKVPLDGTVVAGSSVLDTSALTGEFLPREIGPGSSILAGFINKNGVLTVKVTKAYEQSTVARILDMVENASAKKAPTEKFITKFARYYTPGVVVGAALLAFLPPLIFEGATFSEWINRALVFLVVSCPCALVISIPLSFFGGIGAASRNGILIKGSNYLEALNNVKTMVFDKTGTLTEGVFEVSEVHTLGEMQKEEILHLAALAEAYSSHPIATSILKRYGRDPNKGSISDYREFPGYGVTARIDKKDVVAGNARMMEQEGISFSKAPEKGTVVYVAQDRVLIGYIVISDRIRKDVPAALHHLRKHGIQKIFMLTGDNKNISERVGKELEFDKVYAELLPDQKVQVLEEIAKQRDPRNKIAFIGDGINDAPVLARADIGFAMGGLGSDAAIEAADIVLMTDEPSKIVTAVQIAQRTRQIVWQNIIFALGVKAGVLLLGAVGVATMWEAVFADVGVAVIAILNATRVMRAKQRD